METFQNRRKNYYIKNKFQRNFIIKFCSLVAAGSLISVAIIYLASRATVTTSFENSRLAIKSTADYILPAALMSGAIAIVLIGLAAIVVTLLTSHRIAGPLYRMEKDVEEVMSGNLKKRFNLRVGDELKPLAANLDTMTQGLRARVFEIKKAVNELDSACASGGAIPDGVKENIRKLKLLVDQFDA